MKISSRIFFSSVAIALLLISAFVTTIRIMPSVSASPAWFDVSWTKRKPITIGNGLNPSNLIDYQVKINVGYDSDMKTDFSDLRFTASDGVTLISYWIESYTASVSAVVWVKVPSIPASGTTTIYVYYGKPSAISTSSGRTTFDFFDDFAEGREWTPYSGNPVLSPSGTEALVAVKSVLCVDGTYYMYFGMNDPSGHRCIGRAISSDGFSWKKDPHNPILVSSPGQWDSVDVSLPNVWYEDGEWYMLYGGNAVGLGSWHVGLATSSNGIDWTKSASNPVLNPGAGQWDSSTEPSCVMKVGSVYYLWYYSIPHQTGLATSTDLTTWTRDSNNPIFGSGYCDATLFKRGEYYYLIVLNPSANFDLYREKSCTFYATDREYLFEVKSVAAGWEGGTQEHTAIMTDNVFRNSYSASSDQLWCYYAGDTYKIGMLYESDLDSALLPSGAEWTSDTGNWAFNEGAGMLTSTGIGENRIRVTDFNFATGYAVRARMNFTGTAGNYFGPMFAYQDSSNFYAQRGYVSGGGSEIKFTKQVAGVFSDLDAQSYSWNENQYYVLESQWKDSNEVDTFVNDSPIAAIAAGLESWTSGGVGIRNYHPAGESSSCDWFIIRKCASPEPTTTLGLEEGFYTLTVVAVGSGYVDLNSTGPYPYGDAVQLTAVPATGWSFDHWSGDLSGSVNPDTIVIDGDKTVTATFTQDHYTLTVTVVGGGSVSKSSGGQNWWSSNFGYRMRIAFNNAAASENLIDFAVPVVLSAAQNSFWQHVNRTTGSDIRFVFSDNTTELYYAIEKFDTTNNASVIWVKTNITASSTTDYIWLYYGNSTVSFDDHGNSASVWDSNFTFVSYMKDDPDSSHVRDSTANGNNGTKAKAGDPADTTSGKIGDAQSFNGSTSYIQLPASNMLTNTTGTLAAWVKAGSSPYSSNRILSLMRGSSLGSGFTIGIYNNHWSSYANNGTAGNNLDSGVAVDTNWHFIVATDNGTTHSIYVDGVLIASETLGIVTGTYVAYIGTYDTSQLIYMWKGLIDELSISKTARSAAWIKAFYQYSNDQSKFSYASEESNPSGQTTYTYGTVVTLTATANVGWSFSGWSGDASGTANPTTVAMTGNKFVTANFTAPGLEFVLVDPTPSKPFEYCKTFKVEAHVTHVANLTDYDLTVNYGSELLSFVGVDWTGGVLGTGTHSDTTGTVQIGASGGPFAGSDGLLFTLTFHVEFDDRVEHIWRKNTPQELPAQASIRNDVGDLSFEGGSTISITSITLPPPLMINIGLIRGDLDCNGVVNMADIGDAAGYYGQPASAKPEYDLTQDGVIDIYDIVTIATNYGYGMDP